MINCDNLRSLFSWKNIHLNINSIIHMETVLVSIQHHIRSHLTITGVFFFLVCFPSFLSAITISVQFWEEQNLFHRSESNLFRPSCPSNWRGKSYATSMPLHGNDLSTSKQQAIRDIEEMPIFILFEISLF